MAHGWERWRRWRRWRRRRGGAAAELFDREPYAPPASAGEGELVGTNYERKFKVEGRVFRGMVLRKR